MGEKNDKETIAKLNKLQHRLYEEKKATLILFEGAGGNQMSYLINGIISLLEPRGIEYSHLDEKEIGNFLKRAPAKGRISIYDKSWYSFVVNTGNIDSSSFRGARTIERYYADNGVIIVKIYLDMKEKTLIENKDSYPASLTDDCGFLGEKKPDFSKFSTDKKVISDMISDTNTSFAPWDVIQVGDYDKTVMKIAEAIVMRLEHRIDNPFIPDMMQIEEKYPNPREHTDFSSKMTKEEYKKKLAKYQSRLAELQCKLATSNKSLILGFEGWDAAGKGGSIKRLTQALNPRGYTVTPIAAPSEEEKARSHIWRFAMKVPEPGHIAIFDRTWYGRMMVEPIEGFCSQTDYQRAATEINLFEGATHMQNCIIIKFWMDITKDEQLNRFKERQENPMKQWKITDEDWRNREKWDIYEKYVNSMIKQTNTPYAPWYAVESVNKYYGRIKVLKIVCDTLERELK